LVIGTPSPPLGSASETGMSMFGRLVQYQSLMRRVSLPAGTVQAAAIVRSELPAPQVLVSVPSRRVTLGMVVRRALAVTRYGPGIAARLGALLSGVLFSGSNCAPLVLSGAGDDAPCRSSGMKAISRLCPASR